MSKPWENPAMLDLRARYRPTDEQIAYALGALSQSDAEFAIVGLAHPGKDHGFWTLDTVVLPVPLAAWVCDNDDSYYIAMEAALLAAERLLDGAEGSISYAVVKRDGTWAVFEGFAKAGR